MNNSNEYNTGQEIVGSLLVIFFLLKSIILLAAGSSEIYIYLFFCQWQWYCTQGSMRWSDFLITGTRSLGSWWQLCCMACDTENKLCTTKLYVTPMMQQSCSFPSCTTAPNQIWATCCAVTSFDNFLHTKSHSSPWSFWLWIVLPHLRSSKQFVLAHFGRIEILWWNNMSVDFVRKVTGV